MCWSMASFIRNGGASCSTEFVMIAASASPACHRYGRKIPQQPPHQAAVVRFAEDFFVGRHKG